MHHAVPHAVTLLFGGILTLMVISLALEEKLHAQKSMIVSVFAVLCLFLGTGAGLLPVGPVFNMFGEQIEIPVYIAAIDWSVIAIILGSSLFVDVTSRSGLFTWIAIKLTKASRGDPLILLACYGVLTVVFSAALNNVTAMIIVGSLTGVSLKRLGREEQLLGFLLVEGLLTNVGGLLTLISSVPNIIVGQAAGFSFLTFFLVAAPYVVLATGATIWLGARIFGIQRLETEEARQQAERLVAGFDENDGIQSVGFFRFGAVMSFLFIGLMAATSVLPVLRDLGMGFVACTLAVIMLFRFKESADRFYKAVDWDLLGFFAGLFIVIHVMEHARVLHFIGLGLEHLVGLGPRKGAGALLVSAAGFSSVTDNIPLSAMLAHILADMPETGSNPRLWWSVIFGANLGGNITPIGSASTVVAVTIMHRYKLPMGFGGFVRRAAPFVLVQLALAVAYVVFFLG